MERGYIDPLVDQGICSVQNHGGEVWRIYWKRIICVLVFQEVSSWIMVHSLPPQASWSFAIILESRQSSS